MVSSYGLKSTIAVVLKQIVLRNEMQAASTPAGQHMPSLFHSHKPATIDIVDYLTRLEKYLRCSDELLVAALIYLDRVALRSNLSVNSLCVHRVFLTSLLLAIKVHDDHFLTNSYVAKVGGISTREINRLELDFLMRVDFRLEIPQEQFQLYFNELRKHMYAEEPVVRLPEFVRSKKPAVEPMVVVESVPVRTETVERRPIVFPSPEKSRRDNCAVEDNSSGRTSHVSTVKNVSRNLLKLVLRSEN